VEKNQAQTKMGRKDRRRTLGQCRRKKKTNELTKRKNQRMKLEEIRTKEQKGTAKKQWQIVDNVMPRCRWEMCRFLRQNLNDQFPVSLKMPLVVGTNLQFVTFVLAVVLIILGVLGKKKKKKSS
jgi:hypothetical protein